MTKTQRRILIVALAVALLMLLVPPWETFGGRYLGHSLFTSPPGHVDLPELGGVGLPVPEPIARISWAILFAQLAALWIVAGGVTLLLARKGR